jgi:P4 family phage/plasmid primase-like protien
MGYCMTPDTSMEKMLYMRGPTGSGKGTVLSVIQQMVGDEQAATPQFDGLSANFGLQSLVGKLVCLIGDARDVGGSLQMKSLQVLLSIVGRDALQIDRKFREHLEGNRLTCRITIASNTFLNIPDSTGALQRRLALLEFSRTITNPDITLKDRLKTETAGIALWALQGLRRLRTQGRFTTPLSSVAAMEEWKLYNNPLASFLEECVEVTPKGITPRRMLWDAWVRWADQHKQRVYTKTQFFNDVMTLATYATTDSVPVGGANEVIYRGMSLTRDAARRYLGKP